MVTELLHRLEKHPMSQKQGTSLAGNREKKASNDDGSQTGSHDSAENVAATAVKRRKHISTACEGCRRRKIKCNGRSPCQRCGNLSLECVYAATCCDENFRDSYEYQQMKAQIETLEAKLRSHGTDAASSRAVDSTSQTPASMSARVPISTSRRPHSPMRSHFHGATSSTFCFNMARSSLQVFGITGLEDSPSEVEPSAIPPVSISTLAKQMNEDPIWHISREEALRLIQVYDDECGSMYPVVDILQVRDHVNLIYDIVEMARKTSFACVNFSGDLNNTLLKAILATAIAIECNGESDLAARLFEDVQKTSEEILWKEPLDVELKRLKIIVLKAIYQYHCDDECLAWRTIGQAARICVELGLHHREMIGQLFNSPVDQIWALRLFWSIYVLDRRWSFGCGLSFAIRETDIDPTLPEPDHAVPYLIVMVRYSRIASQVWRFVSRWDLPHQQDDIEYLEYQLLKWKDEIPPNLQMSSETGDNFDRTLRRLRVVLFLRFNQMRLLIHRRVLSSPESIQNSPHDVRKVLEIAKESIQAIIHLDQTSDIYRTQQVSFNRFLFSSLTVILLANCQAPGKFSEDCTHEFYMAVNLIKWYSRESKASNRLWKRIHHFEELGPRLGLTLTHGDAPPQNHVASPHEQHPRPVLPSGMSNSIQGPIDFSHSVTGDTGAGTTEHRLSLEIDQMPPFPGNRGFGVPASSNFGVLNMAAGTMEYNTHTGFHPGQDGAVHISTDHWH